VGGAHPTFLGFAFFRMVRFTHQLKVSQATLESWFPSSCLGTHLSAKLLLGDFPKQSLGFNCVPKRELGNEQTGYCFLCFIAFIFDLKLKA